MSIPIILGTKAQTLAALAGKLESASVLPLFAFTVASWKQDPEKVLTQICAQDWSKEKVIVRSSAKCEDSQFESMAGYFDSVANVMAGPELERAICSVIASYGANPNPEDEVLVQPMLQQVIRSGVAFTVEPSSGAAYRVIEWVDGNDTAAVTSGGGNARTFFQARGSEYEVPAELRGVFSLLAELEELLPETPLDVEFAETSAGTFLLQTRRLVLKEPAADCKKQSEALRGVERKVAEGMCRHPFLHGARTVYGVMPDWNPAEILGLRPRPLALSLYRELITDAIWAYQRNNYGYQNLRSHPLLLEFHGLPYIDTRVCFNSFIPRDIEDGLADRLVDHYLFQLAENPAYHDKVEFEILFTCYTFDLPQRIQTLKEAGFSDADCNVLSESLKQLTNRIINVKSGLWQADSQRIETLGQRRERLYASAPNMVTRIYWLLEDCKRYGTLPFAGLARAGFIAVSLLRSLVAVGVLEQADHDRFINSLNTVSGLLPRDRALLERNEFLHKYGHLRPGTYDILSSRYDEAPDLYFDWSHKTQPTHEKEPFSLSLPQMRKIGKLLTSHGLESDVLGFFDFLQAGIELRESSKFEFTRNVSDALVLMAALGEQHGFSRDDMSYVNLQVFYRMHSCSTDPREALERSIEEGRQRYEQTRRISLPPVIVNPSDVWSFEMPASEPNFVTQSRVTAEVAAMEDVERLAGRIVCIASADPGFDWLFSRGIVGLITAYGGANSHMAIRANELNIPSVIGAGESNFQIWSKSRRLGIDCANKKVEILV